LDRFQVADVALVLCLSSAWVGARLLGTGCGIGVVGRLVGSLLRGALLCSLGLGLLVVPVVMSHLELRKKKKK
jgi:hypothetical protein